MPKYTVANKINHYHDSGKPATVAHHQIQSTQSQLQRQLQVQQQQSQEPSARADRASSRAAGRMQAEASLEVEERKARPVSQSILSTKSLANLITITRRPLEPAERRKPKQPISGNLDDNHYHHRQQTALDDDTRDHLKPLYQLHHRKQKRIISSQKQQQQQNKLNINNNIGKIVKTAPMRRTIATRQARRSRTTAGTIMHHSELAFIAFVSLSVALVGLMATSQQAHGLDCYHCSSVDDPGCDEAFASRANYTETDCRKHLGPDKVAKVCRKIVQHIEDKMVVIRSCGYIDEHDEKDKKPICYKRSGTFAIMMESCNCYENNCNSTLSLVPSISVLSLAALFCSLWLLHHERKKQLAQR